MIYEYYINSILSGMKTQIANFGGNAFNMAWFNAIERTAEVAMSKMTMGKLSNDKQVRDFAELGYLWKGIFGSVGQALSNAVTTWKHDYSPLNLQFDTENEMKWADGRGSAIPGRIGRIVRIPTRTLQMADEFARTIASYGGVGLHAYRIAKSEGLSGNGMSRRIAELTANHSSLAWERALSEAAYQTFQQRGGPMARGTKAALNQVKQIPVAGQFIRYQLPFTTFMVNSFGRAADLTPGLGLIVAIVNRNDAAAAVNWNRTAANQLIGIAAMAALANAFGGDDEDGLPKMRGTSDRDEGKRSLQYRTGGPMSFRIGDSWYTYDRAEPFNVVTSLLVDVLKSGKLDKSAFERISAALTNQVDERNYMQGLSDLIKVAQGDISLQDAAANTAVGFLPNVYRQASRETRNIIYDTRLRSTDSNDDWYRKLLMKAELPVTGYAYRYDIWGRELQTNAPRTSLPWRLLSISKRKDKEDVLPVDVAILRWNEMHANNEEKQYNPSTPDPPRVEGEKLSLNEYESYAREYGEIARMFVEKVQFSDPPTEKQIKFIERARGRAQRIAKRRLLQRRAGITPPSYRGGET